MPTYTIPALDGQHDIPTQNGSDLYHDVSIRATGEGPVAGTVTLTARKPGSDVFESVPDGSFDLAALNSIQFTGAVAEYRLVVSGLSGVSKFELTDTSQRTG